MWRFLIFNSPEFTTSDVKQVPRHRRGYESAGTTETKSHELVGGFLLRGRSMPEALYLLHSTLLRPQVVPKSILVVNTGDKIKGGNKHT